MMNRKLDFLANSGSDNNQSQNIKKESEFKPGDCAYIVRESKIFKILIESIKITTRITINGQKSDIEYFTNFSKHALQESLFFKSVNDLPVEDLSLRKIKKKKELVLEDYDDFNEIQSEPPPF